jgi:hypothetical protein
LPDAPEGGSGVVRRAEGRLVRCYQTESTREMVEDIRAETGEQNWLVLFRLVQAEWLRRFYPADDGIEGGA